jgi:hypothetical protein
MGGGASTLHIYTRRTKKRPDRTGLDRTGPDQTIVTEELKGYYYTVRKSATRLGLLYLDLHTGSNSQITPSQLSGLRLTCA